MNTANQKYKEYKQGGGTLVFKEWIDRERKKNFLNLDGTVDVPINKPLTDSINAAIQDLNKAGGVQTDLENKYIFGINRKVLILAGVGIIVTVAGVIIYKKMHKK